MVPCSRSHHSLRRGRAGVLSQVSPHHDAFLRGIPPTLRTHSAQLSSWYITVLEPSTFASSNWIFTLNVHSIPKSRLCSFQNVLQKCLLLSCHMATVAAVLSRRFSPPLYQWLAPLSFGPHVSSLERPSRTIVAEGMPRPTHSLLSVSSLWSVLQCLTLQFFFLFNSVSFPKCKLQKDREHVVLAHCCVSSTWHNPQLIGAW